MSLDVYRVWMTVLVFGEFYRIQIWRGLPEDFVIGDIVPWGLLEFEQLQDGQGWVKVGVPDWAIQQVWEKTIRR